MPGEEVEHQGGRVRHLHAGGSIAFTSGALAPAGLGSMVSCTVLLFDFFLFAVADFFRQDGIASAATWVRFLKFVFVAPGAVGHVIGPLPQLVSAGISPLAERRSRGDRQG